LAQKATQIYALINKLRQKIKRGVKKPTMEKIFEKAHVNMFFKVLAVCPLPSPRPSPIRWERGRWQTFAVIQAMQCRDVHGLFQSVPIEKLQPFDTSVMPVSHNDIDRFPSPVGRERARVRESNPEKSCKFCLQSVHWCAK